MTPSGFPTLWLPIPAGINQAKQALLVFGGLEQYGHSYEVRIFVNNPAADDKTPLDNKCGYIGSFHIYGYGHMPAVEEPKPKKHALLPMEKRHHVAAQHHDYLRQWAGQEISLTLVPLTDGPVRYPVREDFYVESVAIELQ